MKKHLRRGLCLLLAGLFVGYGWGLRQDLNDLEQSMARLHIVGAADVPAEQERKLRDGVLSLLNEAMEALPNAEEAEACLRELLPRIREKAEEVFPIRALFDQ